jgi:uncharacterized protein (TIGR02001 family)
MKLSFSKLAVPFVVATSLTGIASVVNAGATGNIGVYSSYVLRGVGSDAENDGATVMGGLDYAHDSGIYLGYWGANLDYGDEDAKAGFEHDYYAGWSGELGGGLTLSGGLVGYYYLNVADSNSYELTGSLGYGPVSLGMKYLLKDVAWGNAGDTYLTLGGKQEIGSSFTLGATLGYYLYEDSGDFEGAPLNTETDGDFRHLDVSLSHPIGETGATWSLTYTVGGKTRDGESLPNATVLGIGYNFDL